MYAQLPELKPREACCYGRWSSSRCSSSTSIRGRGTRLQHSTRDGKERLCLLLLLLRVLLPLRLLLLLPERRAPPLWILVRSSKLLLLLL